MRIVPLEKNLPQVVHRMDRRVAEVRQHRDVGPVDFLLAPAS